MPPDPSTREKARETIAALVERYARNHDRYRSSSYNEETCRAEFITPLFEALGWDVTNKAGDAEQYKDVIHEEGIKVGDFTKAPDYTFRVGGIRKFFVEAKKPFVDLKSDPAPAYQLRRYAWSAKLSLSVLTDFEEIAVYDTRIRPKEGEKPSVARLLYLAYDEILPRFGELWDVFSKEAVRKGSFDSYAEGTRGKRGTSEVDAEFLREIEGWRDELARNLANRNEDLSADDLNFAVQTTIDRIIFLRIAEGRGAEPYGSLLGLVNGPDIYRRLVGLYRKADARYNSGLFDFKADRLTTVLAIDDKVLKPILSNLYYPQSPYEFSVLPTEILGNVYEQFLGKVIRLTKGHRAVVEEKPEVKKAGGVYYTPAYIVDYIVRQTVGALCDGKSPKQMEKLRILDPACGSGSFLLRAYQEMLDRHLAWYRDHQPEKHRKEVFLGPGGDWRLTTAEKRRIVLNNIYGVDIDRQAVEVSKLSLLLKVLEGENDETLTQHSLFGERALPSLEGNIKCGNSLMEPDFYKGEQAELIAEENRTRINTFDWRAEYPAIMQEGGFTAVIGNPPYVLLQDEFRDDRQLAYFRSRFASASYKLDTYHLFMERAVVLTKQGGLCSMITPANFLTNNHLDKLRRFLLDRTTVQNILVIDGGVFRGVSVDNAVFLVRSGVTACDQFEISHARIEAGALAMTARVQVSREASKTDPHVLFSEVRSGRSAKLWSRVADKSHPLGDIADVSFGKQLRDRKVFTTDVISVPDTRSIPRSHRPCYTGRDVNRYCLVWGGLACLDDDVARRGGCWDAAKHGAKNKLVTRQIGRYPDFALDTSGWHCLNTMFMITLSTTTIDPLALLGVLNSSVTRALWLERYYDQRRTFPKIKGTYLKAIPIPRIPEKGPDRTRHDRLVKLVDAIMKLHKKAADARNPHDATTIARQITSLDGNINRIVYELYDLSSDEIEVVENGTRA